MSDFEQLVRASRLYYELGETQNAIAEQLGVTRPQVSRLLKRARAEGIVEIRIVDRTAVESPAADALRAPLRARRRPPRADRRRARGPDPADGRPARRRGAARRAPHRRDGRHRRRRVGGGHGRRARGDRHAGRGDGRPAVRRLLVDRHGARAVPPGRRRARWPAARADGAGAGRRRRHATGARRARRRPGDHRPVGSARRRPVRDRRPDVERVAGRRGGRSASSRRPRRSARSSSRRSTSMAGSCARPCATGSSRSMPAGWPRVPVSIGVASGEAKVRPILGALRAGIVRTLVTDVATAEAVVALDASGTLAHGRAPLDERAPAGRPRPRSRHDRGQGRARHARRRILALGRGGLRARRRRRPGLGRAGPGGVVVGGGRRGPGAAGAGPWRTSSRSASTATVRRSSRSTRAARRPAPRSRSSTRRSTEEAEVLAAATGIRGWSLGGLPAALWVERHEPAVAAGDAAGTCRPGSGSASG